MANEVAKKNETFALVTGTEGMTEEAKAELEDELDDLDDDTGIMARAIKMPSGSVKAFSIEGATEDDAEVVKEFDGVILFTHRINAYWPTAISDTGAGTPPECSSFDGKTGLDISSGEMKQCATCPHNQFRTDGTGKECKNMRRVYLLRSGQSVPYLLSVPPTSMKDFTKSLKQIMAGSTGYTHMVLTFGLKDSVSKGGIHYSKLTVRKKADLSDDQAKVVEAIRKTVKEQYKTVAITSGDYDSDVTPAAASDTSGADAYERPDEFTDASGKPEDLPFA